ncbi:Uncharacterized protein APZ42_011084 [Daphnia magna]|uniref:Uncharacterized protein n=1 Tax=Daphnia magna TaxID=35525 RepID=A0A162T5U1_9CRUS|nr:Uncharacterized protein APZ42_011084 [Daphnia magna]
MIWPTSKLQKDKSKKKKSKLIGRKFITILLDVARRWRRRAGGRTDFRFIASRAATTMNARRLNGRLLGLLLCRSTRKNFRE